MLKLKEDARGPIVSLSPTALKMRSLLKLSLKDSFKVMSKLFYLLKIIFIFEILEVIIWFYDRYYKYYI